MKNHIKRKLKQDVYCNIDGIMVLNSPNRCIIMFEFSEKAPNSETVGWLLGANYSSVECFSNKKWKLGSSEKNNYHMQSYFQFGHVSSLIIMSGCKLANCQVLLINNYYSG